MYAVIFFSGHQYKVKLGDRFRVDNVDAEVGKIIDVNKVLLTFNEKGDAVKMGQPLIDGMSVELKVLEHLKGTKVRVYKMHAKKRYRRNKGHRQDHTLVEVVKIGSGKAKVTAKDVAEVVEATSGEVAVNKVVKKKAASKKSPVKKE